MAASRRGLVAPQNTFIDTVNRKAANQGLHWPAVTVIMHTVSQKRANFETV